MVDLYRLKVNWNVLLMKFRNLVRMEFMQIYAMNHFRLLLNFFLSLVLDFFGLVYLFNIFLYLVFFELLDGLFNLALDHRRGNNIVFGRDFELSLFVLEIFQHFLDLLLFFFFGHVGELTLKTRSWNDVVSLVGVFFSFRVLLLFFSLSFCGFLEIFELCRKVDFIAGLNFFLALVFVFIFSSIF